MLLPAVPIHSGIIFAPLQGLSMAERFPKM